MLDLKIEKNVKRKMLFFCNIKQNAFSTYVYWKDEL